MTYLGIFMLGFITALIGVAILIAVMIVKLMRQHIKRRSKAIELLQTAQSFFMIGDNDAGEKYLEEAQKFSEIIFVPIARENPHQERWT